MFKTTEPSGVMTYKYDEVDRLSEAAGPTGTYLYEYDGNSNRTRQTVNGVESFFAVDAADQLCHQAAVQVACGSAPAGATTFSYDDNGNLTGQSDGRVLTYNAKDQNTSFKAAGGATSSMGYFGTGQAERTGAAGATFTNGPLGVASSSVLLLNTSYVRDPSGTLVSQKGLLSTHYYLFDRLGSVVALTDGSGNAVNRYLYDPYGNRLAGTVEAVSNPWQFAGGFRDSFSGYTKFGERYYDPAIGRWTQRDPSGMDANSYGYAGANPVNFVDLTGLAAKWAERVSKGLGLIAAGAQYFAPVCPHCAVGARAFSAVWDAGIVGYDCAIARRGCRESATRFAVNQAAGFGLRQVAKFPIDKTLAGAQEISNRAQAVAGLTQTAVGESMNLADRWT